MKCRRCCICSEESTTENLTFIVLLAQYVNILHLYTITHKRPWQSLLRIPLFDYNGGSVCAQSALFWKLYSVPAAWSSLLKRMLSVGLIESSYIISREKHLTIRGIQSIRPEHNAILCETQRSSSQRLQSTESVVSVMRSGSGQAAGHWDSLVVWMVSIWTCLPIPLFLSLSLWLDVFIQLGGDWKGAF